MFVKMPTDREQSHWTMRGVAMLSGLSDMDIDSIFVCLFECSMYKISRWNASHCAQMMNARLYTPNFC